MSSSFTHLGPDLIMLTRDWKVSFYSIKSQFHTSSLPPYLLQGFKLNPPTMVEIFHYPLVLFFFSPLTFDLNTVYKYSHSSLGNRERWHCCSRDMGRRESHLSIAVFNCETHWYGDKCRMNTSLERSLNSTDGLDHFKILSCSLISLVLL